MSSVKVESVVKASALVGEGPVWEESEQTLLFVDIAGRKIHRWNSTTNQVKSVETGDMVGFAVPRRSGGYVAGVGRSIVSLDWSTQAMTSLVEVDEDKPNNRLNDGKVDPTGRLLAGTMGKEQRPAEVQKQQGSLFSVTSDLTVTKRLSQVDISNGLDWSLTCLSVPVCLSLRWTCLMGWTGLSSVCLSVPVCLSLRWTYLMGWTGLSPVCLSVPVSQVDISNGLDWSLTCLSVPVCLSLRWTCLMGWTGLSSVCLSVPVCLSLRWTYLMGWTGLSPLSVCLYLSLRWTYLMGWTGLSSVCLSVPVCLSLRWTYLMGWTGLSPVCLSVPVSQVDISNGLDWSLVCLSVPVCLSLRWTYLIGWTGLSPVCLYLSVSLSGGHI
ncbi:regucalcin isoform X1 [Mastacembelus armatus]|uniref:regucalcin isoform X1 n=1 Tax=Mastacembelus armatus TaxID=205130 RepID=UPI000E461976|nr:regucalcin isoform X1 [Mastacembelus armatus]